MAKRYKKKGVHTSPDTAGRENMAKLKESQMIKDEDETLTKILPAMRHGQALGYTGLWSDEQLAESIGEFFDYCSESKLVPRQPILRLWLNVEQKTLLEWKNNPNKYGKKSKLIKMAFDIMEAILQDRIEKYPTGNIFLLKTSHGHVETSKVEVSNTGNAQLEENDIKEAVEKLGLGKKNLQIVE